MNDLTGSARGLAVRVLASNAAGRRYLERKRLARTESFFREFISPGSLCFDLGANVGDRTAAFRALGAKVVAVEPQPGCVETLRERFRDDAEVTIVPKAVASEPGVAELAVSSSDSLIATLSDRWQEEGRVAERSEWDTRIEVRTTSLDELISEHGRPDFVKIDVEGFEQEVVNGLSAPVPALSLEIMGEFIDQTEAVVDSLSRLGRAEAAAELGESRRLQPGWTDPGSLFSQLRASAGAEAIYGDVYVRFS